MILIIESGSTKTEWIVTYNREVLHQAFTDGINPLMQAEDSIEGMIKQQLPALFFDCAYSYIYYYGAGCVSDSIKQAIQTLLLRLFNSPSAVDTDLVAAARGLLQNDAGIACVLGTGSNSCFYDGQNIVKNVRPLGYILGDEGSGSVLGKMFLGDCLKGLAPENITADFFAKYGLSYEELISRIYKEPYPNRFMAQLSRFLAEHINDHYVHELIYKNFELFFARCIRQYNYKDYPLAFSGSIAYYYKEILIEVATGFGTTINKIVKSPTAGLIEYHRR